MEVQWVYGNPVKKKKRALARSKKRAHNEIREGKTVKKARRRVKSKRNPYRFVLKKDGKIKKGRKFNSATDKMKAEESMRGLSRRMLSKKTSGKAAARIAKRIKKARSVVADVSQKKSLSAALSEVKKLKSAGWSVEKPESVKESRVAKKRKKKVKKARKAKKSSKKKFKAKKVVRVKRKAKKSRKRKAKKAIRRRRRKAKVASPVVQKHSKKRRRKKKKSVVIRIGRTKVKIKENPMLKGLLPSGLPSYQEAAGLVVGGAIFGAVNGLATRIPFVKEAQKMLIKVPVVGPSLVPAIFGIAAAKIGEKQGIKALKIAGDGLIAASIVNVGVALSQLVPMLKPSPIAGIPEGLGEEESYNQPGVDYGNAGPGGADYGSAGPGGADFGEVVMEGVEYFPNQGLQGIPEGMNGIPEGMGAVEFFPESSEG